eukprot:8610203-Alexandrium_andersonii.AAC.1
MHVRKGCQLQVRVLAWPVGGHAQLGWTEAHWGDLVVILEGLPERRVVEARCAFVDDVVWAQRL